MKRCFKNFNETYNFLARVSKLLLLVAVVVVVCVKWPEIDLDESARRLVEQETPLALQSEKPPTAAREPERDPIFVYQTNEPTLKLERAYLSTEGELLVDEALVVGSPDFGEPFEYRGRSYRVSQIREYIGLLVSNRGSRGPVLRGITFVPAN